MRGLTAVLLCLVLASCGQTPPPPQAPASSSPASDTSTPSIPAPLPPSSAPLTTTPSPRPVPGATTLRGMVSAGVEVGCLILNTSTEQYLLLGADPAIAMNGAAVEVTGKAEPGAMTTCQQGTPFRVESTVRINP
ncbi:hypothetical protein [Lentzea sp. NPDC051838]|uniref:hypothetical protein n=1 Tax=Lentzea sp. NPDC051838 TaxID=3154849 RepID=UPI003421D10C